MKAFGNFGRAALVCAMGLGVTLAGPATAKTLQPFLVFGDSLSDAGFFGGQVTNGDTWAAQLGATTELGNPTYNFAQAGANATGDNPNVAPLDPLDFDEQITLFEAVAPPIRDTTTAVVWFGGNDLLGAANAIIGQIENGTLDPFTASGVDAINAAVGATIASTVGAITAGITRLEGLGITSTIIAGLPDFGTIPRFISGDLAPLAPFASQATDLFNGSLWQVALALDASPDLDVQFFNTQAVFDGLIAGSPGNGFTNPTGNCSADGALIACQGYLYFDDIHPTDAAHGVVASGLKAN